jgi:hypothetical protein
VVRGQARFQALLIAVSAACLYVALLAAAVLIGSAAWEENFREWLYAHTERGQFAMEDVLTFGERGAPMLTGILVLGLFATRHRWASLFLLAGAGGAAMLSLASQATVGFISTEARDFPSGQASGSAALVATSVLLLWDWPQRLLIVLVGITSVGLYGFILVATNWHGPSEVVGGWCLALAWVLGIWLGAGWVRFQAAGVSPPARRQLRGPGWYSRQKRSFEPRA